LLAAACSEQKVDLDPAAPILAAGAPCAAAGRAAQAVEPRRLSEAGTENLVEQAVAAAERAATATLSAAAATDAEMASWARRSTLRGDFSDGLSTTELPAASAGASFQVAIISG
jgi:hypothetical protein